MTDEEMENFKLQSRKVKKFSTFFQIFNQKNLNKVGCKTNIRIPPTHFIGQNIWILKALDLNRGRGIKIANSLDEIKKTLKKYYDGTMYKSFKKEKQNLLDSDNNKDSKDNKDSNIISPTLKESIKEVLNKKSNDKTSEKTSDKNSIK